MITPWDMGEGNVQFTIYMHVIIVMIFYSPNEIGETTLDAMFMDA